MPFKDKEVQRIYQREYHQEYDKRWQEAHPDKVREYKRKYREKHHKEINERWREYKRLKNHELRNRVIMLLGGKCAKCGIDDGRVLQIDHINGNGNVKRRSLPNCAYSYYKRILEAIKNGEHEYQILCANCNWIKRYEMNENPKMVER